jgi:hypothetical protein
MPRDNTPFFIISSGIASKFEDLRSKVFEDGSKVY